MESPLYGTPPSPPPIEEEIDLHVLVVPPYSWRRDLRLAYSVVCAESVSAGFIRVSKQALLSELRQCIEKQLETLLLPSQFVLLRNLGRCLTWVSYKQEHCLTASIYAPLNIRTGELYIIDSDYVTENAPFLRNKEIYPLELSGTLLSPFPPVSTKSHEISQPYSNTKYSTLHAIRPDSPDRTNYSYRRTSLPQIHLTSTDDSICVTPTISTYSTTNQNRYSNPEAISGYHDDKYMSPGNVATNDSLSQSDYNVCGLKRDVNIGTHSREKTNESSKAEFSNPEAISGYHDDKYMSPGNVATDDLLSQSDHNVCRLKTDVNIGTHSREKTNESSKAEFIEDLTDFKTELAKSSVSISSQSLQNLDTYDKKMTVNNEQHNPIVQVNISLSDPEVVATTAKLEQTLFPIEDKNTSKVPVKTLLTPQSPLQSNKKSSDVTASTSSEGKSSSGNNIQEDKVTPVKKDLLKPPQQKTKMPVHVEKEHVKVSKKTESKSSEQQVNNKKHLAPKTTKKETSLRKDRDVVNKNKVANNNNGTTEEIIKAGSREVVNERSEQPEAQESKKIEERNKDYDDNVSRLLKEIETVKNECNKMSTTTGLMTTKIRKAQMSIKKQRENVDLEWKRRFFQEKQRSSLLEDQISVCKGNIDVLKSFVRANHHKQGGFTVSSGEKPSEIENYKKQCRQVELEIEELKERLAKTRKHLAIEQKARQNATREHKLLKQELLEKQIEFTRTHITKNLFT